MGIELCDLNPDNATIRQTNKNIHPRLWAVGVRVGYRSAIQPQASQQRLSECRFPLEVRHDKSSDCDLTNGQPIVAANLICRLPDYRQRVGCWMGIDEARQYLHPNCQPSEHTC
jgi:hypothetical protein